MTRGPENEDELPWVRTSDVWELFGFPTYDACRLALSRGRFPVPTYRLRGLRVVDKEVVRAYFLEHRMVGLQQMLDQAEEQYYGKGKTPRQKYLQQLRRQIKTLEQEVQALKQERLEGAWSRPPWE